MASRPTIIIIPGAWQQPPIWEEFCTALKGARYPTQLVALPSVGGEALPLAGLAEDVAAVRSYIGTSVAQGEEIILVCHCSGAIVGSNAVIGFDRPSRAGFGLAGGVIQMVFLAGFIASPGNSLLDVLGGEPLPWMHIQGDRVTGLAEMFPGIAFNDLSKQDQDRWAGQMTHTSTTHFSGKTNYAPWDHGINCAYIFCLEDKVLPYDIQQNMADLLGSKSGRLELRHTGWAQNLFSVIETRGTPELLVHHTMHDGCTRGPGAELFQRPEPLVWRLFQDSAAPRSMSITIDKILAAAPATTRGQPTQLSCDAKGERITYASGKSVFVRSIDNPAQCKQYTGHTAQTTVAKFAPSGFYIASGDASGMVRVWDAVEAVNTKGEYHIINGRINDIAWDGDSQRIIAVGDGRERFGHCITADSGNSVGEVSGHSKVVNAVSIRQQRPLRAATVSDDATMCFLHGAPFKFNSKAAGLHKGFVFGSAFSPDGSLLVTVGADKRIQLYDGKTGEPTKEIGEGEHTGSIFAVSWAKDSKRFVTASADQTVKIWDVESGKVVQSWRLGQEGSVSIPDQQVGVVWPHGRSDGLIISVNLNGDLSYMVEGSDKPVKIVQGHNKSVTSLAAGSDGKGNSIWTGSFDGRVCHWDVGSGVGSVVDGQSHTNQVTQFAASSGRTYSVAWDDTLRIIDESAATFAGSSLKLAAQPKGIASTQDGRVFVALADGVAVYVKDQLASELKTSYTPTSIAASSSYVAVGGDDNAVHVYKADPSSHRLSEAHTISKSTAQISALAFSRDGAHLAAGNSSGKIYVFKAGGDWPLATDRWSAHTARVTSIAWSEAGTHAVSGGLDTNVFVWSLAKPGSRVKALNAHKDGVNGVAWVEGGNKVASSGGDAAVKVWSVSGLQ